MSLLLVCTTFAFAATCVNAVTVTSTGTGVAGLHGEANLREALSEALAGAIAQTSGVHIDKSVLMEESTRMVTTGGQTSVHSEQEFHQRLSQRLAGTILDYRVLGQRSLDFGLEEVTIEARVCLDDRIALSMSGDPQLVQALGGLIGQNVDYSGWQLLTTERYVNINDVSALVALGLELGATLVGTGSISIRDDRSGRFPSAIATASLAVTDTRTLQTTGAINVSRNGIGHTQAEANNDALDKIAQEISKELTSRLLQSDNREVLTLVFRSLRRENTRFTLAQLIETVPGVIHVTGNGYDPATREARIELEASTDACSIARNLLTQRRVLVQLESCDGFTAALIVTRD